MELKQAIPAQTAPQTLCLNRTFYGIETTKEARAMTATPVLIVPFMELKQQARVVLPLDTNSLNRTFYGIETWQPSAADRTAYCLNRTFYGIETIS